MFATLALAALLALLGWIALAFNRLVRAGNLTREAWSGIDVQLKRRHDLVPALVETTRGHARFERDTFDALTNLRGQRASRALQDGENALSGQLRELLAVAEAYPELRASESFLALQSRLAEVEHQLQMARRYYNGTVRDLNIAIESFPSNVVARGFGFALGEFFQVESASERAVPEVRL